MILSSQNNWITTNLHERFDNPNVDFFITIKKTIPTFQKLTFQDAADYTAKLIASEGVPLYVALSGGYDSDFVTRVFHRNNIPFTAIIVEWSGNKLERQWAYHVCRKLNIKPMIIKLDDELMLNMYRNTVVGKLNSLAYATIPGIVCAQIAKKNNGCLITGEYLMQDDMWNGGGSEWDYYSMVLSPGYAVAFFMYTPEIVNAMFQESDGRPQDIYKNEVYNIEFRSKIYPSFEGNVFLNGIAQINETRKFKPQHTHVIPHEDMLQLFETW